MRLNDSMATPRHRRKVRHRELRTQRGDDIWAQNDIVDKKSVGKLRGNQLLFKKNIRPISGTWERNQKQLWRCPNFLSCSLLISSSCVCGSLTPGSSRNTKTAGFQSPEYYVFHIKDTHSMVPNMCKSPSITRVSRECLTLCGRD